MRFADRPNAFLRPTTGSRACDRSAMTATCDPTRPRRLPAWTPLRPLSPTLRPSPLTRTYLGSWPPTCLRHRRSGEVFLVTNSDHRSAGGLHWWPGCHLRARSSRRLRRRHCCHTSTGRVKHCPGSTVQRHRARTSLMSTGPCGPARLCRHRSRHQTCHRPAPPGYTGRTPGHHRTNNGVDTHSRRHSTPSPGIFNRPGADLRHGRPP